MALFLKPREPARQDLILNFANPGEEMTFALGDQDWFTIQLASVDGTAIGTGVVTLQVSIDGANFLAFPSGVVTISAFGVNALRDVTGFPFLKVYVSTTAAGVRARVTVYSGVYRA